MTDTAFDKRCERCDNYDLVLSHIHIDFNYGSKNDGESITLAVCGNCIDKIYEYIINEAKQAQKQECRKIGFTFFWC